MQMSSVSTRSVASPAARACVLARRSSTTARASTLDQNNPQRLADMPIQGLQTYGEFTSKYVDARRVDVWLPPGYSRDKHMQYPVLYMHDGQNLFDPKKSFLGVDWGVDEAMVQLIHEGAIAPSIVVGIWNTGEQRVREYTPKQPFVDVMPDRAELYSSFKSDDYLKMIVEELKPLIDSKYRTFPGQQHTAIMGANLGALVSLYAVQQYPQVFGLAGCISTQWPAAADAYLPWLKTHVPSPDDHVVYFAHGTQGLDAEYSTYQQEVDEAMRSGGFKDGVNFQSVVFDGDTHNEVAWRQRLTTPLRFLLGRLKVEDEEYGLCKTRY